MIPVQCPTCARVLQIPDTYAGQTGACTHCKTPIQVPSAPAPQVIYVERKKDPAALQLFRGCLMGLGVVMLFALGVTFFAAPIAQPQRSTSSTPASTSRTAAPSHPTNEAHATLAEFNSLWEGMTYEEASRIIGSPGTLTSSTAIDGIPGYTERTEMKMYTWRGPNGIANMNATFHNNRLMNRSQLGLR